MLLGEESNRYIKARADEIRSNKSETILVADERLMNILLDLEPSLSDGHKNILKRLFMGGYFHQIALAKNWYPDVTKILSVFVDENGFQEEKSQEIFETICIVLGHKIREGQTAQPSQRAVVGAGSGAVIDSATNRTGSSPKPNEAHNNWEKYSYPNGDLYEGELKEGKPHGEGKIIYAKQGWIYEGQFLDGKPHGIGVVIRRGKRYKVTFKNGIPFNKRNDDRSFEEGWGILPFVIGSGRILYSDGSTYKGRLNGGKPHGQGKFIGANGTAYYEGDFKDGKRSGYGTGTETSTDGNKYEGEFRNGLWHGKGTITYANGSMYEGQLKYRQRDGYGIMIYEDGTTYEGSWEKSKRSGQGRFQSSNGTISEGEWREDKMIRISKMTFVNGAFYEGILKPENKIRKGKMTYP
ncbi:MAG: hypothetical protein HUJ56_04850, partial [Erysipelotrichaceae bacterium]|nr:hypothetical protein [Erysipelotrichaceae bacterium]